VANVIRHKNTDKIVKPGDWVLTPEGLQVVDYAAYTWKGAVVRVRYPGVAGSRWAASECGCYVTSEN
jgi:hypothetical protein